VGETYAKLNAHFGTDLKVGDHNTYWVNDHFGLTGTEFHEVAHQVRLHDELTPIEGLAQAMLKVAQRFKIQFNSSRGALRNAHMTTTAWLTRHQFPCDDLVILKHGDLKWERFKPNTKLFVEDNANHALEAADSGKVEMVWLVDKPWNQHVDHPRIQRIKHDQLVSMLLQYFGDPDPLPFDPD
jgi:uncharacterized HAD superfamily protein